VNNIICPECKVQIAPEYADGGVLVQCPFCSAELNIRIDEKIEDNNLHRTSTQNDEYTPSYSGARQFNEGEVIGGYVLISKLGAGSMGQVWLANQVSMQRKVALKILYPQYSTNKPFVYRFDKEVKILANLDHPNIVTAYDAGEANGVYYLAMKNIQGQCLKEQLIEEGVIPEPRALRIIRDVACALSYAWNQMQLLHRDIKPANIMIDESGAPLVMDMGISRSKIDDQSLTVAGSTIGTPYYMSPEQADGDETIDFRSDIYSLGVTLYHMITGAVPYEGSTTASVLKKHVTMPFPPPQEKNPAISDACAVLLETMMAKHPDNRYQSWTDIINDIDRIFNGMLPAVMPVEPRGPMPEVGIRSLMHSEDAVAEDEIRRQGGMNVSDAAGLIGRAGVIGSVNNLGDQTIAEIANDMNISPEAVNLAMQNEGVNPQLKSSKNTNSKLGVIAGCLTIIALIMGCIAYLAVNSSALFDDSITIEDFPVEQTSGDFTLEDVQAVFNGRIISWKPETNKIELFYDFSDEKQLDDWRPHMTQLDWFGERLLVEKSPSGWGGHAVFKAALTVKSISFETESMNQMGWRVNSIGGVMRNNDYEGGSYIKSDVYHARKREDIIPNKVYEMTIQMIGKNKIRWSVDGDTYLEAPYKTYGTNCLIASVGGNTFFDNVKIKAVIDNAWLEKEVIGLTRDLELQKHLTASGLELPKGTTVWRGHAYKYFEERMRWKDAREYCRSLGGHLVTIADKDEDSFVYSLCNKSKNKVFTGLLRHGHTNDTFAWVTGEPYSYQNWVENEPSSKLEHEDFVAYNSNPFGWCDVKTKSLLPFVCEWEPTYTKPTATELKWGTDDIEPWIEEWEIKDNNIHHNTANQLMHQSGWIPGSMSPDNYLRCPPYNNENPRTGILLLHPVNGKLPVKMIYQGTVSADKSILKVVASGEQVHNGDCVLKCIVNGKVIRKVTVPGNEWNEYIFDLSEFIDGEPLKLELHQQANGWWMEELCIDKIYFDSAQLTSATDEGISNIAGSWENEIIPKDAKQHGDNYYKVYSEDIPWDEAKEKCEKLGGHLAYIADPAERKFISTISEKKPVWLGGQLKDGECFWNDGSLIAGLRNAFLNDSQKNKDAEYVATSVGGELRLRPLDGKDLRFRTPRITGYICEWEKSATIPYNVNLVQNPGNEEPLVDRKIPGWEYVQGNWTQRAFVHKPCEGKHMFFAERSPYAELRQTINLQVFDLPNSNYEFSCFLSTYDDGDQAQVILSFYDSEGKLLKSDNTTKIYSPHEWVKISFSDVLPANASLAVIKAVSIRKQGSNNDGYLDDFSFKITPKDWKPKSPIVEKEFTEEELKHVFHGEIKSWDPKTGDIELFYDFSTADQIKDWFGYRAPISIVDGQMLLDQPDNHGECRFKAPIKLESMSYKGMSLFGLGWTFSDARGFIRDANQKGDSHILTDINLVKKYDPIKNGKWYDVDISLAPNNLITWKMDGDLYMETTYRELGGKCSVTTYAKAGKFDDIHLKGKLDLDWLQRELDGIKKSYAFKVALKKKKIKLPTGAIFWRGHAYKLYPFNMGWEDAKAFCEKRGGHLATITSKDEDDFAYSVCRRFLNRGVIFGLKRTGVEMKDFAWVTGEKFEFNNWAENQPDNRNNAQQYAEYIARYQKWNDIHDDGGHPFLCEWESPLKRELDATLPYDAKRPKSWLKAWEVVDNKAYTAVKDIPMSPEGWINGSSDTELKFKGDNYSKRSDIRKGMLAVHPLDPRQPGILRYKGTLSRISQAIAVDVSGHARHGKDFILRCVVNGKLIAEQVVDSSGWQKVYVNLKEYVGKKCDIQLHFAAGGREVWNGEFGFVDKIYFTNSIPLAARIKMKEKKQQLDKKVQTEAVSKVPSQAILYNGNHYMFYEEELSWSDAQKACLNKKGRLVIFNSPEEHDFVTQIAKGNCVWVGAQYEGRKFSWSDGSLLSRSKKVSMFLNNQYKQNTNRKYLSLGRLGQFKARPLSGKDTAYKVPRIQGYICEWGANGAVENNVSSNAHSKRKKKK